MKDIEAIGKNIVDAAVKVHKALGPGLLESAYQQCLALFTLKTIALFANPFASSR